MSKERELLKRWFCEIGKIQCDIKLLRDTQELLAQPEQATLKLSEHLISAAPELLEALENWINALDDPSEWMKCRDDAKKATAKAHGIGVDDE